MNKIQISDIMVFMCNLIDKNKQHKNSTNIVLFGQFQTIKT